MTSILIVEDEGLVARNIRNRLKKLGYEVAALVSSGEEAICKVEEMQPDLVLMDIVLEGDMDGVEAAKQICSRFNIPVVYLTSYADNDTLERAKMTEPFGYILKPFEIKELHSSIEIALRKHDIVRKLEEREKYLTKTLNSVSDAVAVIVTDTKGFVTFMNPLAEALTGWKQEDALNRDLDEVFNILSEQTRTYAEKLIAKTLQEGVGIGLTNHTILISKYGTETLIDVSAAPIRDDNEDIIGVALVFRDITGHKQVLAETLSARELEQRVSKENIPISLMVATSSSLVREGIRKVLESEQDVEIVAEASTTLGILPLIEQNKPDVLLIDTAMPNLDVQEILGSAKERSAETKALLLLYTLDEEVIANIIYSGARGYLTAELNAVELIQAIRAVSRGKVWAEIKVITKILTSFMPLRGDLGFHNLTKREREIVKLVTQGYSNKKISSKLFISEGTVKIHLNNIFKKLGIKNRAQLTLFPCRDIS
ncbi:MAG TPA: response regulator [Thermodesulfobacteriota bacterium]|nr:response regulator [Thermodesulfobacteriota bacterium]